MADRSVEVRLRADVSAFVRGMGTASAAAKGFAKDLDTADSRMGNLVQTGLALAPALVPIGGLAVPAIAGLVTQLGFAVTAAGVSLLAFNGVGDALKALNTYQLEPTTQNFAKMQEAMATLGPAGQDFVRTLQDLRPEMQGLQDIAQEGLFPGVTEGLDELMVLAPQVESLIGTVASTLGNLVADAGDNLNDARWVEFFEFLDAEAGPTLEAMGKTLGNFVEGIANMMMAFDPLSDSFTNGLLDMSRGFKEWSDGLDSSQGFQDFISYIQDNGPAAMEALGAIGEAFVALVKAAAPIGAATLPIITALAKTLAAVAESPAGPVLIGVASGLAAISRAIAIFKVANGSALMGLLNKSGKSGLAAGVGFRAAGAGLGMLALSMTDLDEKAGLSNTAMFALMGMVAGPWGAAIGGAVGLTMDLASANDDLESAVKRAQSAFDGNDTDEQIASLRALREEINGTKEDFGSFVAAIGSGDVSKAAGFGDAAKSAFLTVTGAVGGAKDKLAEFQAQAQSGKDLSGLLVGPLGLTAEAFDTATQSAEAFSHAIAEAFGLLDKRASLRAARDAIRDFNQEMKDAPDHLRKGSAAYDQAEDALDNIASTSLEAAKNLHGMNRVNFLDKQRGQFLDAARALGMTRSQAAALADSFKLLDKTKAEPKIDADNKSAKRAVTEADFWLTDLDRKRTEPTIDGNPNPLFGVISAVQNALAGINNKTVTITSVYRTLGRPPGNLAEPSARGNLFYANGDVANGHQPQLAPGGPTRMWAEPETGGEAYIPLRADSRRPRAKSILEQTAGIMGGQVHWFSGGGTAGAIGVGVSGGTGHGIKDADDSAKSFAKRLKEAQKELEKETEQRRTLISDMKSFKSDVAGSFQNDIFGNGVAGLDLQLEADRNDSNAMKAALKKAKKKGLDGGLFAALAASGDLTTAQQLSGMSRAQIARREKLFSQTRAAQSGLGQFAANEKFGDAIRESNQEVKHLRQTVNKLEARIKHMGKDVEDGARRGIGDRDRRTAQRSRAGR